MTKTYFELILNLSTNIAVAIDKLCEYAYGKIYNESIVSENVELNTDYN